MAALPGMIEEELSPAPPPERFLARPPSPPPKPPLVPVRTTPEVADSPPEGGGGQAAAAETRAWLGHHTALSRDDLGIRKFGLTTPEARQQWRFFFGKFEGRGRKGRDPSGDGLAISQSNLGRTCWTVLIVLLLVYTGTIFVYRVAFIELNISRSDADNTRAPRRGRGGERARAWRWVDQVVTVIFWMDVAVNFFFTYRDSDGREVRSLRCIAWNYLSTYFIIDVVACMPEELMREIFLGLAVGAPGMLNQGAKILRLQRVTRLAHLMRLTRLAKVVSLKRLSFLRPFWQEFKRHKCYRIVNLSGMLGWVIHMMACGWYVCAALHDDHDDTWVARRTVDAAGEISLLERGPLDQWMQSVYFIMTVFTTLGFGDMSPMTRGEIVYLCFTMLVGTVVHSVIVGEVIRVLTSIGAATLFIKNKTKLVEAFAEHMELSYDATLEMSSWASISARSWMEKTYNRDEMMELVVGRYMPRAMLERWPLELFSGKLCQNRLLTCCQGFCGLPPELPMILALFCQKACFEAGEIVYSAHDHVNGMFLVHSGTFAHVAHVSPVGGRNYRGGALDCNDMYISEVFLRRASSRRVQSLVAAQRSDGRQAMLRPYSLFSHGSYFGEVELFLNCMRKTTARCESRSGWLLGIHKSDFMRVAEDFPQFGALWKQAASRHDRAQKMRKARLKADRTHEHLAASLIQRAARGMIAAGGLRGLGRPAATLSASAMVQYAAGNIVKLRTMEKKEASVCQDIGDSLAEQSRQISELRSDMASANSKLDAVLGLLGARAQCAS